jgi:hypothetical protein
VAYTPDWEPLVDALKRVVATNPGASEDEAKVDLCRTLADRKIRVRVRLAAPNGRGKVFANGNVEVPPHLRPADLDWVASLPFAPWPIGPKLGEHYFWTGDWENKRVDLIEVSTVDLIEVLCHRSHPETRPALQQPTNDSSPSDVSGKRGAKSRGVQKAIDQLWPDRKKLNTIAAKERDEKIRAQMIKDESTVPQNLSRAVQRALKAQ